MVHCSSQIPNWFKQSCVTSKQTTATTTTNLPSALKFWLKSIDCWVQTMKYFIFLFGLLCSSKLKKFKSRHPKKSWPVYFSKYKTVTKCNGFSGSCVRRLTLVFHTGEPKIMTNGASCWALQERDTIHGCSRHRKKRKKNVSCSQDALKK